MESASSKRAFGYLFFTFFIWASIYVAGKLIAGEVPPYLVACLRCVTGILPLLFMSHGCWQQKIARQDWKWLALIGFLGYFLTFQLIQLGISLTGASIAALVNSVTPVAVTVLAAFYLKEKITVVKCFCLVLAIAGTVVISGGAATSGDVYGIIAILAAVIAFGAASVFIRSMTAKYPPVLVTTYGMVFSLFFNIPVGMFSALYQPVHFSPLVVGVIIYLGFIGSGVAQFSWTKALSLLPASTCSLFYPLQPIFSAFLGAIFLGETFTTNFFIGLVLISLDVVLNGWEARRWAAKA